jgi:cytochrome c-type biogenesis protein CcmH/NrfG
MPKSKLEKQKEAEDRAKIRSKRTNKDQLSHLDALFGQGLGAAKERAKLIARIEQDSRPKKKSEEASSDEKPKKKSRKKAEITE